MAVAIVAALQIAIVGAALLIGRNTPTYLTSAPADAFAPVAVARDGQGSALTSPSSTVASDAAAETTTESTVDISGWATALGPAVGIPPTALAAYGRAQLAVSAADPKCGLAWPTLAAIGWVESHHGQVGGAQLLADGRSDPPIVGVALNDAPGRDIGLVRDTDDGALDGDATYDRAVGPMQFLPGTWAVWGSDGDGDALRDPYDIDDAALAAARYLCASGTDLRTGTAWRAAIFSYNHSESYVAQVWSAANSYATASLR